MIGAAVLTNQERWRVQAACAALEAAEEPVGADQYAALGDPALFDVVRRHLHAAGRTLIDCGDGRWLTGYRDDIADTLIAEDAGPLTREDRAVLTLVLLHTVAVPRAAGRIDSPDWTEAEPVSLESLADRQRALTKDQVTQSVRRLRTLGVLRHGHAAHIVPGPQFLRLTAARSARLWEELVLLAGPDTLLAQSIRAKRLTT